MLALTLTAKIYDKSQLRIVEKIIVSKLIGLKVQARVVGVTERGWVRVSISGEDEVAAQHYLANDVGACPESLDQVEKNLLINGRIGDLKRSKEQLFVDVGVFSPDVVDASVPLSNLQAQLADGRKATIREIGESYNFCDNLPITVEISKVDRENGSLEGFLADKQLFQYQIWTKSLLDRLIVLGASLGEVEYAVKSSGSARDVVKIESLGLFEHVVVCKLGTDAAGLIPQLGRRFKKATFSVFDPRRIMKFVHTQ
jgi:hypothetical protein